MLFQAVMKFLSRLVEIFIQTIAKDAAYPDRVEDCLKGLQQPSYDLSVITEHNYGGRVS